MIVDENRKEPTDPVFVCPFLYELNMFLNSNYQKWELYETLQDNLIGINVSLVTLCCQYVGVTEDECTMVILPHSEFGIITQPVVPSAYLNPACPNTLNVLCHCVLNTVCDVNNEFGRDRFWDFFQYQFFFKADFKTFSCIKFFGKTDADTVFFWDHFRDVTRLINMSRHLCGIGTAEWVRNFIRFLMSMSRFVNCYISFQIWDKEVFTMCFLVQYLPIEVQKITHPSAGTSQF